MTIDTVKWRACAPLLPDGGCEAVRELCDEIDRLRAELAHAASENLAFNIKVADEINALRAELAEARHEIAVCRAPSPDSASRTDSSSADANCTLASNLAIAAALCASFDLGLYNTMCGDVHPSVNWRPGCRKPAP